MKTTKKILVLLVAIALFSSIFAMAGCDALGGKTKIGVAMPTKSLQRWNQDGSNMEKKLKEAGYDVDLQYANDDPALQISQIENMITRMQGSLSLPSTVVLWATCSRPPKTRKSRSSLMTVSS